MRKTVIALLAPIFLLSLAGCAGNQVPRQEAKTAATGETSAKNESPGIKISWFGQSCFLIETPAGKIITDPFYGKLGYPMPKTGADIVTVSHQHFDHNAVDSVPGKPEVVNTAGLYNSGGIKITGINSYHDKSGGSKRGGNIIYVIESEGLRICHLGDLGHLLDRRTLEQIGKVDVLLAPVGGFYTIDAAEAKEVINRINPGYVIPMHYKTDYINSLPIAPVDGFLELYPSFVRQHELELLPGAAPEKTQVFVLDLALK